jgi:hypothetical protein
MFFIEIPPCFVWNAPLPTPLCDTPAALEFRSAHAARQIHALALADDQSRVAQDSIVLRTRRFRHRLLQPQGGLGAVEAAARLEQFVDDADAHRIRECVQDCSDRHVADMRMRQETAHAAW